MGYECAGGAAGRQKMPLGGRYNEVIQRTVTFTARWVYGAKDLDRLSEAANLIRTMLHNMNVEAVLTNLATDGEGNKKRDD